MLLLSYKWVRPDGFPGIATAEEVDVRRLHCVICVVESALFIISPLGSSEVRSNNDSCSLEGNPAACSLFRFCCSIANNLSNGVDKLLLSSGGGGMAIQLY